MSVELLPSTVPVADSWVQHGAAVSTYEFGPDGLHIVVNANEYHGTRIETVYQRQTGDKMQLNALVNVISGQVRIANSGSLTGPVVGVGQHDIIATLTVAGMVPPTYLGVWANGVPAEFYVSYGSYRRLSVMAITSDGFELSVSLVDSGGDQSTLRYQLVAADMTEALAAATTVLSRLDAVTDAVVKGYFVGERYTEDALSLPGSGVQVEQRATVICQIDGDPLKKVAINIPAPVDGLFVGGPGTGDGYNTIDTTDAALALYTDIWAVTGALATISDGEYLSDAPILRGRRTHRQSSRG